MKLLRSLILTAVVLAGAASASAGEPSPPLDPQTKSVSTLGAVRFPGPPPGEAVGAGDAGRFTLGNAALSATWQTTNGGLRLVDLTSKLTGRSFPQSDAELFRLALKPVEEKKDLLMVGIRLDPDTVTAVASRDGTTWSDLASYPRSEFPGEPKLVRLGKMNLKAEAKNNPGDAGPAGEGSISEITPPSTSLPDGRFAFKTGAHQATVTEYPFPAGNGFVSCRIEKGTDQGMSFGPALALVWEDGKRFILVGIREKTPVFNVTTGAGEKIIGKVPVLGPVFDVPGSSFRLSGVPKVVNVAAQAEGIRVADRIRGVALEADLVSERGIRARWRAELRDGSNYIRQSLALVSVDKTVPLHGVELMDIELPDARTIGTVDGCPVSGSDVFLGVEVPGARNTVAGKKVRTGFACQLELTSATAYTFGSVMGVVPAGQLRRGFLYYMERERARPTKPFLHYNCWYDLGFSVNADKMMDVVNRFNEELVKKRGVPVLSYLVDDGWDSTRKGLWAEDTAKFPGGFANLKTRMQKADAHLGIWISPLGGYGGAEQRNALATKMGLLPEGSAFDLAQPAYKKWFEERCLQLMREGGVNAFKWDRAGEGVSPHFMALLDVARNLRKVDPNVFVNVTVGTWPSPFWLNHVDSTWRMGSADVGWAGKGDDREKWLTFRDGYCRSLFVEASPLYPLNSAMHHGIVHGRCFQGERVGKSGANLKNEARSYFANGATLQELYLTPSMMTDSAWDEVAEAAKWAHANADVLVDAHWIGGDPLKMDPYGYAAWNRRKGTLMVRNPDDAAKTMTLDVATVFELPAGAPQRYALRSPYKDQRLQSLDLTAGKTQTITLEPFEVLVFDAEPVASN
ncbi:MAG: alpha-galactosidase [Luteolibacter sp.]